jgi:hypothetical protein
MATKWGYLLEGPGRPELTKQRDALRALGVDFSEGGPWRHDSFERGSTRPRSQLTAREELLKAVQPGDTVVFAAPLCIALSPKDAAWCLGELSERGVSVIVNGDLERIEPNADLSDMLGRVASAHNVHHVRTSKARAAKEKKD